MCDVIRFAGGIMSNVIDLDAEREKRPKKDVRERARQRRKKALADTAARKRKEDNDEIIATLGLKRKK